MDLISVIIPVYNLMNVIEKCILSITNQTYENLEIIIIDDGSTDNTYEIIKKYISIDNRIKCYKNENKGVGFSYNFGIEHSRGKYIYILDGDNFIELNTIETLYDALINYDCEVVSCGYIYDNCIDGKYYKIRESVNKDIYTKNTKDFMKEFKFLYSNHLINSPCNHLYKKDLIGHKRFNENREKVGTVDTSFNLDLIEDIHSYKHVSKNLVHYVQYPKEKRQLTNAWKEYDQNRVLLISVLLEKIKSLYLDNNLDLQDYYNISAQHLIKMSLIIAKSNNDHATKLRYFQFLKKTEPFCKDLNSYSSKSMLSICIINALKKKKYFLIKIISFIKTVIEMMPNKILNRIRNKINKILVS